MTQAEMEYHALCGWVAAMESAKRQAQRDAVAAMIDRFADELYDERNVDGWLALVFASARLRGIDVDRKRP